MPVADLVSTYFPDKTELAVTAKVHALRKAGWTFDSIRRRYWHRKLGLKVLKDIIPLPFNVAPMNLLHYNQVKSPKLAFGPAMNYVCMNWGSLQWINPGWSDKIFEIYKGHMMWYEDGPLLKRMKRKYG